jgi:hypothetical protein
MKHVQGGAGTPSNQQSCAALFTAINADDTEIEQHKIIEEQKVQEE